MEQTNATHKEKLERDQAVVKKYNLKTDRYVRKVEDRTSFFDFRSVSRRTDDGQPKNGRIYSTFHANKNGGIRVNEMIYGLKVAHLSMTDDGEDRLEQTASANGMAALIKAVGGDDPETTAKLPLTDILKKCFDLNLDCWMDETGFVKGRAIDTQGYIASNDDTIVLAYRFSTTIYDWLANLSITTSEWQVRKDEDLGHAGYFSSVRGWWRKYFRRKKNSRPRVHTAYYNNFLYTVPMIRKHIIDPLKEDFKAGEKPRKIYVVGCSLGAAISQLAYCFILDELFEELSDPEYKKVSRLISVTAGCPRVADKKMRQHVTKQMNAIRKLDRAVICRMVYNDDIVPHIPPFILNYRHLDKLIYITKKGEHVLINPDLSKIYTKFGEIKTIFKTISNKKKKDLDEDLNEYKKNFDEKTHAISEDIKEKLGSGILGSSKVNKEPEDEKPIQAANAPQVEEKEKTEFEIECENAMPVIHDHMPFWYMTYLDKLKEEEEMSNNTKSIVGSAEA